MSTNVPLPPELWTDERIREAFIYDGGESEHHDPINGAQTQRQVAGSIFDAWLAAHDTALRESLLAPPTDVREALIGAAMSVRMTAEGREVYVNRLVAAILASPDFEIHLRGAVTPPADDVREAAERRWPVMVTGYTDSDGSRFEYESDENRRLREAFVAGTTFEVRPHGTVTAAERYAVALRAIADGDGPDFVREFARDALRGAQEVTPADDVREALGRLGSHARHGEIYGRPATVVEVSDLRLVLDAFTAEVCPHGTVTEAEVKPVIMHIASGNGTACGLDRARVSHITNGVRYADCVPCLRTVAQS